MATTVNLLSEANALMRSAFPPVSGIDIQSLPVDWQLTGGSFEIITSDFVVDSRLTLKLYPSGSTLVLSLEDIPLLADDNSRVLSANCKIKANSTLSVSSSLFIDDDDESVTANSQTFSSGLYSAVHTNRVVVPDDDELHTATIRFEITNHNGANVFLTLPHLIHDLAFYENPFVGRARPFLPDFYFEKDSSQESPTYPFFRLIDILFDAAGNASIEHDRMYGLSGEQLATQEETTEFWTNSTLVSPRSVRDDYVPWLSQFTCGPLRQNIQLSNGDYYFDNPSIQRDFIEWQLRTSFFGRSAGTREAMLEAVKQVLIKTKDGEASTYSIALTPHFDDDPFSIKIQTLTNETLDADENQSSRLVLDAVFLAKPMGYKVVHVTVDEFFFTLSDPTLGILDSMRLQ